jgi:hypothetical protein
MYNGMKIIEDRQHLLSLLEEQPRMTEPEPAEEHWEFRLKTVSLALEEKDVRRLLEESLQEASAEARQAKDIDGDVQAELRGAFGGVGELIAILVFVGKAFAGGAAGSGGKYFFDKYLKPKLEKRKLYPTGLKHQDKRKS